MRMPRRIVGWGLAAWLAGVCAPALATERVTLRTGFSVDCSRHTAVGDRVRLYPAESTSGSDDFFEVAADAVVSVEMVPEASGSVLKATTLGASQTKAESVPPAVAGIPKMLERAGCEHHVDADLLASVVRAESGGRVRAVSRTGARGLMQLMPGTAAELGVGDAFEPQQNINGGTAYLDGLLTRYHDNIALALAAYNAGPKAVDRYHGVPPYRETRAYVARVIREFNRRKLLAMAAVVAPPTR